MGDVRCLCPRAGWLREGWAMSGASVLVPGGSGKGGGAGASAALGQVLDDPLPGPPLQLDVVA